MKYAYYPGCSLDATGIEYNVSTKAVAKHLGIELWEIPEWNCCGASSAHKKDHLLALALPARNLALAEQENLDVTVPCAACYGRMKASQEAVRNSQETRNTIEEIIEMNCEGKSEVKSILDVMVNEVGTEKIKEKVVKPLTNLNAASYYGCLLVRPPEFGFDDPEDPQTMDNLVEALGGSSVDWSHKTECCGTMHSTSKQEVGLKMIERILADAKDKEAECIVVACPLCFMNLDMRQKAIEENLGQKLDLPVFYFTELMGLAMGYSAKELGLQKHFVDPMPLLEKKDVLRHPGARRDEE